jgi:hypothetical protein
MIEGHRENQRHHKEQHQHTFIFGADNKEKEETNQQNHEFSGHDIGENRAHEKAILTLKKRQTVWAVMPDMKRVCDDPGFATGGTKQSQTATQNLFDLLVVYFQSVGTY